MAERQADPRCECGTPHSDPVHVTGHQFQLAELQSGDRVELVRTSDTFTKLRPGDEGSFVRYGPQGELWIDWDTGSKLAMLPDEGDEVKKL